MREITGTIYVAKDGTHFLNKYKCNKYEEEYDKAMESFENLPKTTQLNAGDLYELCPFGSEDILYCIPITSENVVEIIKKWGMLFDRNITEDFISKNDIGKRIFFSEYDGSIYRFGTPYELKRLFCDKVDELANIKCEVEGENE